MKKYLLIFITLCLVTGCQTRLKHNTTIPLNNTWRHQYRITVELDPLMHTYQTNIELTIKNTSTQTWNEIVLRDYPSQFHNEKDGAISMIEKMVDEKNTPLDYFRMDDPTIINVKLNQSLAPNETLTLSIDYQAFVPNLNARFGYVESANEKIDYYLGNGFLTLAVYEDGHWVTEPYFSEGECFYSEVADYFVKVMVPDEFTTIGTGDKLNVTYLNQQKVVQYEAISVRDFCLVIGNDYQVVTQSEDGIVYNSYYHTANQNVGIGSLITLINETKSLNALLGKYPYRTMNTVETHIEMQGMEYPQLIMISTAMNGNESTLRHELAHQWFYNIVGNNGYQEAWLDESIATYLAEKELSEHIGIIGQNYGEYESADHYVHAMYFCGGSMYTRLAKRFGKEKLYQIFREYIQKYAYSQVKTKDLLGMLIDGLGDESLEILQDYFKEEQLQEASNQLF